MRLLPYKTKTSDTKLIPTTTLTNTFTKMNGSSIQITMLVFLSLFSLGKASNEPDSLEVMHVRVTNQLANGVVLTIHCKSADNDLGVHVLSYGQFIGWHFRKNIWGTTRFYCYLFSKRGNNSFDVFRQGMCSRHCPWFVRDNGTCLETHKPYKSFCYPWPSKGQESLGS